MDDKLLNFVSWIVIGLVIVTIASVWIGNVSDKHIFEQTVYPISYEFDDYALRFKSQKDMIGYFTGLSTF
mgnify:CR=1 FL=1